MRELLKTALLLVVVVVDAGARAEAADVFRDSVVPLLQRRCLSCHNSLDKKGGFSLQTRDELSASGFVEAGKPEDSHLLAVLTSVAGKPPEMPKNSDPLKPEEVAAIVEWIKSGAVWPDGYRIEEAVVTSTEWWSWKPLVRPSVPEFAKDSAFARRNRTVIDAFIAKKLQEHDLGFSAEADRRTLIRRLSFDLTGLPPAPEEVDAFVADSDPQAYEKLVDRMLDSPRYGERWGRHWLDVVRYADTCGYDKDKLRPNAWPYRDYVIRSFNEDKPYGRFVEEQVAGDVLYPNTPDGILGLGFVAAGPWDFIGHVEVPEAKIDGKVARHNDRDEMVTSTLNTFCSVTIQCAQCHNHKFDPITQKHYYSLQAVFAAVDRAERTYDLDPQIEEQRLTLAAQRKEAEAALRTLDAEISAAGGEELTAIDKRIAELKPLTEPVNKRPEYGWHSAIEAKQNQSKWVQIDLGRVVPVEEIILRPCHDEFGGIGAGFGFPVRFKIEMAEAAAAFDSPDDPIPLDDQTEEDVPNPGLAPVSIQPEGVAGRFIRITATKLAERSKDFIFSLAEVQVQTKQPDGSLRNVAFKATVTASDSIEAHPRWAKMNLTDGIWPQARDEAALKELARLTHERHLLMHRINTPDRIARREQLLKVISEAQQKLSTLPNGRMVYAAASSFAPQGNFQPTNGKPRPVHVLHRGNVLQPREVVSPGTLSLIPDVAPQFVLPEGAPEGQARAALAQWITRADNPLTWRSIVNRVWQFHFGQGLVESPNDFGRMGRLPSHPELLDWLAVEFRDGGQSFKKLHRLIVLSAVYRQQSVNHDAAAKIDSGNRLLWRMNRRRLEAEEIRDSILSVSGKLNLHMGGPGYYLFVLERPEHSPHYEYHKFNPDDPASHRRSVYRFIVRSQPDPYMTTLDCADSSQSTPQREETLTSLQALSLLNNGLSLTMARHFAERLQREAPTLAGQIELAMRLTTGREPRSEELAELTAYAAKHGMPSLCRVLFNLSEFVFVD